MEIKSLIKMGVLAASLAAAGVYAADETGNIVISGELVNGSCTLNNTQVAVDFGTTSPEALIAGSVPKRDIVLNLTCPKGVFNEAGVIINGTTDEIDNKLLKLEETSMASGFGVGLFNADGTAVAVGSTSTSTPIDAEGNGVITLKAAPVSTGATVVEGIYSASGTISLAYK